MLGITNVSNAPSVVLKDTTVSTWVTLPTASTDNPNTDYDMYQQGYVYYASIPAVGVTVNTIAEITFSDAQAKSGNYAPVCRTFTDAIRIYSKVDTTITIPSIIIHSIVETYYEMDNSPASGSTKAVTSGGVYQANLPRNGGYYFLTVFGSNVYDGYYRTFIPLMNADRVNISITGMGVVGVSWWEGATLESKIQVFIEPQGIYLNCNDSSVVGKTCNPYVVITGGSA